jgi:hypothetical protein
MSTRPLTADDARALFSDAVDGVLDDDVRRAFDDALADDPALAEEHRRFAATVSALRALPRPTPSRDVVAGVRARLAAGPAAEGGAVVLPLHASVARAENDDAIARPRRSRGTELFAGLAAVAAVVAVVAVAVPGFNARAPAGDVLGAGLADANVVAVRWRAPGLPKAVMFAAAADTGVILDDEGRFVGERDAVARFLVALKATAAARGVDVVGVLPESAARVVVVVEP